MKVEKQEFETLLSKHPELEPKEDVIPMSFCVAKTIHSHESRRPLLVLFDSGSTHDWI